MTRVPVPYPHPHGVAKPHNWQHCSRCQAFIEMSGPAIQRAARKFNEVNR